MVKRGEARREPVVAIAELTMGASSAAVPVLAIAAASVGFKHSEGASARALLHVKSTDPSWWYTNPSSSMRRHSSAVAVSSPNVVALVAHHSQSASIVENTGE